MKDFTSTMPNTYWLEEFEKDIIKLTKQIDYYKDLIKSENNRIKPRLRKVSKWNEEIEYAKSMIYSRKKSISKINNK